jgi:hypothetical protein
MPLLKMIARSLAQRIVPERATGVSSYYQDGLMGRINAATHQLEGHEPGTILDVGCGRDLHLSLVGALRFNLKMIAFDVLPLAELDLINFTLEGLGSTFRIRTTDDLEKIGVHYVVGERVGGVALPAQVTGLASTASFEHVPPAELNALFKWAYSQRIRRISACVDYQDHWSYLYDVPPDHFYYVGPVVWRLLNNRRMYQNRLRHTDLLDLANQHDYVVERCETQSMPLTNRRNTRRFRGYPDESLSIRQALVWWKRQPVGQ